MNSDSAELDPDAALAAAAGALGLRSRDDIDEPGWAYWELRTLNRHRVIAHGRALSAPAPEALVGQLRASVEHHFRRAWWRGLAFGVVAEVSAVPWSADDLVPLVDAYENRRGVLQWLIVAEPSERRVLGVHTWEAVFLSPVYRSVLAAHAARGDEVRRAVKGRDGLWRFLTGVSSLEGVDFPEYHDEPAPPAGR